MDINFVRLIFTLQLEADITDRYAFFGIRPCFAESFRALSGCKNEADQPCSRNGECCPYHQVFSQPLAQDPAALKRFQKPPLPFVFDIPLLPPVPNSGGRFEISLTLAGFSTQLAEEFCEATGAMLASPAFRKIAPVSLIKVESAGYRGDRTVVSEGGKGLARHLVATLSLQGLKHTSILPPDKLAVTILTPMRLIVEGRALRDISFSPFVRALFRRVSSMAYYYASCEETLDYKYLAEQSRQVTSAEQVLSWDEWGSRMSGITGRVTFTGSMTEYHPFLLAGELLHLGKGASFGLGRYVLGNPDLL